MYRCFKTVRICDAEYRKSYLDLVDNFCVLCPWSWNFIQVVFVTQTVTTNKPSEIHRSVRILLFKTFTYPSFFTDFLPLLITEVLPPIGSSLLVFNILPEMDVVKGAMLTNAMSFVPALGITVEHSKIRNLIVLWNFRIDTDTRK